MGELSPLIQRSVGEGRDLAQLGFSPPSYQNYAGMKETTVPCAQSPPPSAHDENAQNKGTASVYQPRWCHYLSRSSSGSHNSHRRDQGEMRSAIYFTMNSEYVDMEKEFVEIKIGMDVAVSELLTNDGKYDLNFKKQPNDGAHVLKAESIGGKANSSSKIPSGARTNCQQPSNQPQNGHKIKDIVPTCYPFTVGADMLLPVLKKKQN
ncbi:Phosphopyruvate hydratase [Forsythia ovata]|uniref:phosphopyruvate hydratase n=1 Tax=Forsythia ovata TaxID=205694 RepID=A0ABD1WC33_9LAMI